MKIVKKDVGNRQLIIETSTIGLIFSPEQPYACLPWVEGRSQASWKGQVE